MVDNTVVQHHDSGRHCRATNWGQLVRTRPTGTSCDQSDPIQTNYGQFGRVWANEEQLTPTTNPSSQVDFGMTWQKDWLILHRLCQFRSFFLRPCSDLVCWCIVVSYTFTFYIRHFLNMFILCSCIFHERSAARMDTFNFDENHKQRQSRQ